MGGGGWFLRSQTKKQQQQKQVFHSLFILKRFKTFSSAKTLMISLNSKSKYDRLSVKCDRLSVKYDRLSVKYDFFKKKR
jgi:hypothetical protein